MFSFPRSVRLWWDTVPQSNSPSYFLVVQLKHKKKRKGEERFFCNLNYSLIMFGRLTVPPLLFLCLIKWFLRWRLYGKFRLRRDLFYCCRARNRHSRTFVQLTQCALTVYLTTIFTIHQVYPADISWDCVFYTYIKWLIRAIWDFVISTPKQLKYRSFRNLRVDSFQTVASLSSIHFYCSDLCVHTSITNT